MDSTPHRLPSIEDVRAALRVVCEGSAVRQVELFGSLARGESHAASDVDLLVDFLPGAHAGIFEMGALKEDLEERMGCRVDLLSRNAIEKSSNHYKRDAILAFPLIVYVR